MCVYVVENRRRKWFIGEKHIKIMKIKLPDDVKKIIEVLEEHGYEAYAVGGCVRDCMLGEEPKDWDITTSARPEQVKELFHRTVDTGIEHGTVTVLQNHEGYEVTTYRIDGKYEDGRHPKEVIFTPSLEEDLKRRDFTINAMAYSDRTGIVDRFCGMEDLQNCVIRCVGEPNERFLEDALRILRAIRFSARLGFQIEENTMKAIKTLAQTLRKISRERIQAELDKLLLSDYPDRVIMLQEAGLIDEIFVDCQPAQRLEKSERMKLVCELADKLAQTEKNHYLRWSLFLTYIPYRNILKSLKFDNKTIYTCEKYYKYRNESFNVNKSELRHLIVKVGPEIFSGYLAYRKSLQDVPQDVLEQVEKMYQEIVDDEDCLCLKSLAVNGQDLIRMGVKPGVEMGRILNQLFELVLEDASMNDREVLLQKSAEISLEK